MGGSNIRHTIMPRFTQLKARNRGSIANSGSRKHLIFPNSGILTKFQCGVTKGPTRNYSRGGIVVTTPIPMAAHPSCNTTNSTTCHLPLQYKGGVGTSFELQI